MLTLENCTNFTLFEQSRIRSTKNLVSVSDKSRKLFSSLKLMNEKSWDLELLRELSSAMMDASICGLGQAAPNPLLSVIKHFPNEVTN